MRLVSLPLAAALVLGPLHAPASAARPKSGAVDPATPGELSVSSVNEGATLEVDGRAVGTLPLEDSLLLKAGEHTVRLSLRGHRAFETTLAVKPGEVVTLEIDLIPVAGLVRITSTPPGAEVSVDGKPEGVTPLDRDILAGERTLLLRLPEYADETRTVTLAPTQTYAFDFALRALPKVAPPIAEDPFYAQWWFWTLVGVAGAGAAAAAVATSGDGAPPLTPDLTLRIP